MMIQGHLDPDSSGLLKKLSEEERIRVNRIPGVRTVLVVLSSAGMVFDTDSLRQKILFSYLDATVFFLNTDGSSIGAPAPHNVDLIIDLTPPGARQSLFFAKTLRRRARKIIGRQAGWFRRRIYDRVFDPKGSADAIPTDLLARERFIQKRVLGLAGVVFSGTGDTPADQSRTFLNHSEQ